MGKQRQSQKLHPHPALRASLSRERERGSRARNGRRSPAPCRARRAVLAQQPHQLEHVLRHRRAAAQRLPAERVDELQHLGVQRLAPESRSEEHTSEIQSLQRTSYADFCLKKKK